MSDRYFLDTNVLVYSLDPRDQGKQRRAQDLIALALTTGHGLISYQVVQELLNVATRKFIQPLTREEATTVLDRVLMPLCEVYPSSDLYREGLAIVERFRFSFYDSMIIAAAREAEASVLYSEDLQHDQEIGSLRIKNPFR